MTPVIQEFLVEAQNGSKRGDCLRATVASLLDLPLSEVPHFVQIDADGGPHWLHHLTDWLHQRGFALYEHVDPEPGEHYIATGPSPRSYYPGTGVVASIHATVYRDEQLVHDPHPSGVGLCEVWERMFIRPVPILG